MYMYTLSSAGKTQHLHSSKRGWLVDSSPPALDLSGGRRASLRHNCPTVTPPYEEVAEVVAGEERVGESVGSIVEEGRRVEQQRLN